MAGTEDPTREFAEFGSRLLEQRTLIGAADKGFASGAWARAMDSGSIQDKDRLADSQSLREPDYESRHHYMRVGRAAPPCASSS